MMSNPQGIIAVIDDDPEISASMASFDRHADIAQKPSIQPRLFRRKINPALILALIDQRLSDLEIANQLGCTIDALRVTCSQLKISLRRPGRNINPALILALIDQGLSDLEIANQLGWTVGTLRVMCSQLKISLRRPGKLVLPQAILDQLSQRAALMGISVQALATDLLQVIARDDLYDAVLDQDDVEVKYAA